MSLPRCSNCKRQMKWKNILKSLWAGYKPIQCDNCSAEHQITFYSRGWVSFLIIFPAVFFSLLLSSFYKINIFVFIIMVISISVTFLFYAPFVVDFEKKSD